MTIISRFVFSTIKRFDQIGYQAWEHMAPQFSVRNYKKFYSKQFNSLGDEAYRPNRPFTIRENKTYLQKIGINKIIHIHNE